MSAAVAIGRQAGGGLVVGVLLGAALALAIGVVGPVIPLLLIAAALAGLWLVRRPGIALGILVVTVIALEEDERGALPVTAQYYKAFLGGIIAPCDLIFIALVLGFAYDHVRNRRPLRPPDPFTWPLLILVAAVASGVLMGAAADAEPPHILFAVRTFTYFLVIPLIVANLLDDRRKQRLLVIGAVVMATYKGIEGTVFYVLGAGREIEGTVLTYYRPTATWLMMLFLLGVVVCRIIGYRLPLWAVPAWLIALAAFVLSFRRQFWIAALLGLVVVVVVATGQHGWRRVVPVAAAFAAAVVVALAVVSSSSPSLSAPVLERAQSINPSQIQATKTDRYRFTEQRNVVAELRRHPVAGVGLATDWQARYPLSTTFEGSRSYTHVVVFAYWLKMGLLGVAAYLSIIFAALWAAWRVWRSRAEALFRAVALALFAGVLGLVITDLVGSHTGVNLRLTIVFATALGWLSAVLATQRQAGQLGGATDAPADRPSGPASAA